MSAVIYYDGECPFCTRYVRYLRLRETIGEVRLVDLRVSPADRARLQAEGFDPDKGMALEFDGQLHFGEDAVHRLALLSSNSTGFNRFNRAVLGSHLGSTLLYPLLRMGRNAALFALGRQRMEAESQAAKAPWLLFNTIFGSRWSTR